MTDHGIGSWIRTRARKSPDRPAVVFEDLTINYGELMARITRLANALRDRGVIAGDRVAYLGDNHPSFLESLFATATLGAIFVPLNTRLATAEVAYQLADSGSSLLIAAEALSALATGSAASAGLARIILVSEKDAAGKGVDATSGIEDYELVLEAASTEWFVSEVELSDPALILYTSGTTGQPKGAILTHDNLTGNALNVLVDYDLGSRDRALMVSPLFHVASLGMGALPSILKGATVVLERRFDPERALALIERHRVTWMSGVPTTFQLLAESPSWATTDLASLATLTCGGSPVPLAVIDAFELRGLSFTGGYGMTEASPGVSSLAPGEIRSHPGSSGQPHFFVDVRIAEPDDEGVGEIEIRGRNVIRGYWNREVLEAFTDDGWFRTGDLGRLDAEGYLYISDRLKDMVISGGENIYPAEIELIIAELDAVSGVAVIGEPHERWGEVPLAIVTLRPGHTLGHDELQAHLADRVARYKIPKRVIVVEELPRTASGKVQKARLREQYGR